MTNLRIFVDNYNEEHVIIDHGNEQFTSMPKSVYDEQQAQAALSTPNLPE
jgi:hypothetical protein